MKTILKYTLTPDGTSVQMPVGAEVLTVREQDDNICVWACVDTLQEMMEVRSFQVFGTGNKMPDDPRLLYVGTAMLSGGALVMHVFESRLAH